VRDRAADADRPTIEVDVFRLEVQRLAAPGSRGEQHRHRREPEIVLTREGDQARCFPGSRTAPPRPRRLREPVGLCPDPLRPAWNALARRGPEALLVVILLPARNVPGRRRRAPTEADSAGIGPSRPLAQARGLLDPLLRLLAG
jgi:hypothetical protein